MLDIRVNKSHVIVREPFHTPLKWQTINGQDGKTYEARVDGTGKTTFEELCRFKKPINGAGLPTEIKDKFSEKDQSLILGKIEKAHLDGVKKQVEITKVNLNNLLNTMDVIETNWEGIPDLLNLLDDVKLYAKKLKWKKTTTK